MPIIYDEYMNEIESTDDNGDNTVENDQKGMAALTHPSPITEMKTETIPDAIQQRMSGAITSRTVGGDDIVSASTNPMMVNTMIPQSKDAAIGMPDNYDPPLDPIATADDVVQGILETDDLVTVESFLGKLTHALEAMGYEPPKPDQLDPNQPVDLALLMDEVQYVDDSALRADERIATITELREEIQDIGGVTKDIAYAVESLRPSIITSKVALERFTRIPSKTNRGVVEAALEDLVVAASVTGLVVIVYAVIKVIKWIIDKIEKLRYNVDSDTVRGQYLRTFDLLTRTLSANSQHISRLLREDEGMDTVGGALCNAMQKMGLDPNELPDNIVGMNTRFMNILFERLIGDSYCEMDRELFTGQTMKLALSSVEAINTEFSHLNSMFDAMRANPSTPIDLTKFSKFQADLGKYVSIFSVQNGDADQIAESMSFRVTHMLEPIKDQAPPKLCDTLKSVKYSLDKASVGDNVRGKLKSMIRQAQSWEREIKLIHDDELRSNRKAALGMILSQCRIVAILINVNTTLFERPMKYIAYMNQTVTRTTRMWNQVFKGYNIKEI